MKLTEEEMREAWRKVMSKGRSQALWHTYLLHESQSQFFDFVISEEEFFWYLEMDWRYGDGSGW